MENLEIILTAVHKQVSGINSVVKNINRGGCGIFAHALSKELIKIGIPAKVITLSLWGSRIENYNQSGLIEAKEKIKKGFHWEIAFDNYDIGLSHLMVYVKDNEKEYFIDSEDIYFGQDDYYDRSRWYERGLEINTLIDSNDCGIIANDNTAGWNPAFDRNNSIPVVYKFVKDKINLVLYDNEIESAYANYINEKESKLETV